MQCIGISLASRNMFHVGLVPDKFVGTKFKVINNKLCTKIGDLEPYVFVGSNIHIQGILAILVKIPIDVNDGFEKIYSVKHFMN